MRTFCMFCLAEEVKNLRICFCGLNAAPFNAEYDVGQAQCYILKEGECKEGQFAGHAAGEVKLYYGHVVNCGIARSSPRICNLPQ